MKKEILGGIYETMSKGEVGTVEQLAFIQSLIDEKEVVVVADVNAGIKAEISEVLVSNAKGMTASEIVKLIPSNVSIQKVVAMLKAMAKDGQVIRTQEGSKVTFSTTQEIEVVEENAEEEVIAEDVQEVVAE